jgi:hypothetical protein
MYLDISALNLFKTCVPLAGIFPLSMVLSQFQHDIQFVCSCWEPINEGLVDASDCWCMLV